MYDDWRPNPGQVALIEPAGGGAALTGLVQRGGTQPLIDVGNGPVTLPSAADVVASFYATDALYRLEATALAQRGDGLLALDVRRVERVQRRAHARARAALPVSLLAAGGAEAVFGETVDIAPGGAGLRTSAPCPEGVETEVAITLPDGMPVVAVAEVLEAIARDGDYRYRIAFRSMADADRERLVDLTRDRALDE